MPLKTARELMDEEPPRKPEVLDVVTYVVPDTEPVLTFDGLARLIAKHPEFGAPGAFAFYEVDRLDLGNGYVAVTSQTLRFPEEDAA